MKGNRGAAISFAEKCRNILVSNWQGTLNTIKVDSKGSKQDIHSSRVQYWVKRGRLYIWVPEKDLHNLNTVIDERASFAVASPYLGSLANLFRSLRKLPNRVALNGEVASLRDEKVESVNDSLKEMIISEQKAIAEAKYVVSGILSSSTLGKTSRSENLVELLDSDENYVVYKFSISSCMFIDGKGSNHEVDVHDFETSKADKLSPLAAKIIDGINQSEIRRRALVILCFAFINVNAKDVYIMSVDRKGFNVMAKVPGHGGEYHWKEFRFTFKEEALDVEQFCLQLVQMEEEALKLVKSSSGL